jgi:hypothetical protein
MRQSFRDRAHQQERLTDLSIRKRCCGERNEVLAESSRTQKLSRTGDQLTA